MNGFDFSGYGEQKEMGGGRIPPESIVKVRLDIRQPDRQENMSDHPLVRSAGSSGLLQLDSIFEVVSGTYTGSKIIGTNLTIPEVMQKISLTKGQKDNCMISGQMIRAILDASRNIHPDDYSQQAAQARHMNDWQDLIGLEFPVKISYDKSKYMEIGRIMTLKDDCFQTVMGGGEIITDKPVPEREEQDSGGGTSAGAPAGHPVNSTPMYGNQQPPAAGPNGGYQQAQQQSYQQPQQQGANQGNFQQQGQAGAQGTTGSYAPQSAQHQGGAPAQGNSPAQSQQPASQNQGFAQGSQPAPQQQPQNQQNNQQQTAAAMGQPNWSTNPQQ